MSKVLDATCDANGVVKSQGVVVAEAVKFGQGAQSSSGLLILDGERAYYLPGMTYSDLVTTINKSVDIITSVADALTQISASITAIAAVTGPSWAPPGTLVTDVATIVSKVTALNVTKAQLNTLKGALK